MSTDAEHVSFDEAVSTIAARDDRYDSAAYSFLRDALSVAVNDVRKSNGGQDRHVTGPELLEGFRKLAIQRFGPMAMTVLETWGVRTCDDVGEMVYCLINERIFGQSENDRREDFSGVFDFDDVFVKPFQPKSRS